MGKPIPPPLVIEPVSAGALCSLLWGPGKAFGDGPTPESVVVNFSGQNQRNPNDPPFLAPLVGDFILLQIIGQPCRFFLDIGTHTIELIWSSGFSLLRQILGGFTVTFNALTTGIGTTEFVSGFTFNFIGGTGFVKIPDII